MRTDLLAEEDYKLWEVGLLLRLALTRAPSRACVEERSKISCPNSIELRFALKPRSMDNNSVLAAGWLKDVSNELHTGSLVADEPD